MTDTSVVKNKLIRLPETLSDTQLQLLSAVLNSSFVGADPGGDGDPGQDGGPARRQAPLS